MGVPASRSIKIYRGDRYSHTLDFKNDGSPYPVDSYTFTAQIRGKIGDDPKALIAEFDVDMSNATSGEITLSLEPEVTQGILVTSGVWDLQVDPIQQTWLRGKVTFIGDVTHA